MLKPLDHISTFSGIGGFDLAAEWMGWNNIAHVEINPFCRKVLNHYWPKSDSYEDIKKTDFTIYRGRVDILTGGFPCQPYSTAGKRKGKEDERHLWPEMLRAIREAAPRWVVGENVRGLVNWNDGLVFDEVQADLEAEGYEVWPYLLPSASVNAPHRRDRIWFVAYSGSYGHQLRRLAKDRSEKGQRNQRERIWKNSGRNVEPGATADPTSNRRTGEGTGNEIKERLQQRSESTKVMEGRFEGLCAHEPTPNSSSSELQGSIINRSPGEAREAEKESRQLGGSVCRQWENFPTQPPICGGNDGLPTELDGITFSKWRNESIKAYGNAIVPQVAMQIFQAINEFELSLCNPLE